jgi:hypothetical protein
MDDAAVMGGGGAIGDRCAEPARLGLVEPAACEPGREALAIELRGSPRR